MPEHLIIINKILKWPRVIHIINDCKTLKFCFVKWFCYILLEHLVVSVHKNCSIPTANLAYVGGIWPAEARNGHCYKCKLQLFVDFKLVNWIYNCYFTRLKRLCVVFWTLDLFIEMRILKKIKSISLFRSRKSLFQISVESFLFLNKEITKFVWFVPLNTFHICINRYRIVGSAITWMVEYQMSQLWGNYHERHVTSNDTWH